MSNSKRYYWLKLHENFFEEDAMEWIEEQENGEMYCLFYLKLCLKTINTKGILIREVGQMLVPYDAKKLSEITKVPIDTVIIAIDLFKKIGLLEILENGKIKLPRVPDMVGFETSDAARKREKRKSFNERKGFINENSDKVRKLAGHCPTEKEKEKR